MPWGVAVDFLFTPSHPRAKRLSCCQMTEIFVAVVIVAVVVMAVAMAIVTLVALNAPNLALFPQNIATYPL